MQSNGLNCKVKGQAAADARGGMRCGCEELKVTLQAQQLGLVQKRGAFTQWRSRETSQKRKCSHNNVKSKKQSKKNIAEALKNKRRMKMAVK